MVIIQNNQIFSTKDKFIHKIGTDTYFKRGTILASTDVADYEEVDELPYYTKSEYDQKVAELVREKYSGSEEFALQRKAINAIFSPSTLSDDGEKNMNEYAEYNAFVEECKIKAKNPEMYRKEEA